MHLMIPKYKIGQKVVVKTTGGTQSVRDCTIEPYIGQTGKITNYYWISPRESDIFFIYMVKIGDNPKAVTLYEDELEILIDKKK